MRTFDVEIYREGKWWMAEIAELGLITQARRLSNVDNMAREAIAVTIDADHQSFNLQAHLRPIEGIDVENLRETISRAHEQAVALEREASLKSKQLTRSLAQVGVPLRDIGEILGLSHQRAHQLLE